MQECKEDHECSSKNTLSFLPTRVLEISGPQPRLHVSSKDEIGEYVALSYCWGGPQAVLTTIANIESSKEELPLVELPLTLRNAIEVTQNLGFSYLWIDALCIIQDSPEDKTIEINKMGSIYRNATLTIFAANAPSVNEGFLQPRTPDEGVVLPFYVSETLQGTAKLLLEDLSYHSDDPLDSRAWVLQETLLSRRRLIFSAKELLWCCQAQEYKSVTSSPQYYVPLTVQFPSDVFHSAKPNGFNTQTPKQVQQSRIHAWNIMVQDLTSRGITEKDDRLPAIAGIASELQVLWSDEYVVGLWRRNLAAHLCWYPVKAHPTSRLARPAVYDCAVDFRNVDTVEVDVVRCALQLKSPQSALGWVNSASLVVKAKVIAMSHMATEVLKEGKFVQDIDKDPMHVDDTYFMLVGFQTGWAAVGLALKLIKDSTFVRTGSFFHLDDARGFIAGEVESRVWSRPEVVRREITLL